METGPILKLLLFVRLCYGETANTTALGDKLEALHRLMDADMSLMRTTLRQEIRARQAVESRLAVLERLVRVGTVGNEGAEPPTPTSIDSRIELLEHNLTNVNDKLDDVETIVSVLRHGFKGEKMQSKRLHVAVSDLRRNVSVLNTADPLEEKMIPVINRVRCLAQQKHGGTMKVDDFLMKPSFVSEWRLVRSYDAALSDILIDHPLASVPVLVDVQVRPVNGSNTDWIFPAAGAIQGEDDSGEPFGGVVFLYNDRQVRLVAPTQNNNEPHGSVVYTGGQKDKWMGANAQTSHVAMVRARLWGQDRLPTPQFKSDSMALDIFNASKSFYEVEHGFGDYPELVAVQVEAGGWYSVGIGSVMSKTGLAWHNVGGVVHGYDRNHVRLWAPSVAAGVQGTGQLFGSRDGWATKAFPQPTTGQVRVLAWRDLVTRRLLTAEIATQAVPTDTNTICLFSAGSRESLSGCAAPVFTDEFMDSSTSPDIDLDSDLVTVSVQALNGPNRGFRFAGWGSGQSTRGAYGGLLYAYSGDGRVRVWRPNPAKDGYMVHISAPYGNGSNVQASNDALIAITTLKPVC